MAAAMRCKAASQGKAERARARATRARCADHRRRCASAVENHGPAWRATMSRFGDLAQHRQLFHDKELGVGSAVTVACAHHSLAVRDRSRSKTTAIIIKLLQKVPGKKERMHKRTKPM